MATAYSQLPGALNIALVKGDSLAVAVDFDRSLTGYTVSASMTSIPAGTAVQSLTATVNDAAAGTITLSLTAGQTANLPVGTYAWTTSWTTPTGEKRTVLSGFAEVKAR